MQIQNSNSDEEIVFNKLNAISQDIISHIRSNRQYKLRQKLTHAYTFIYNQCISKPNKSENMFNRYKEILTLHFVKSANLQFGTNIFNQTNKLWNGYIKFATILAKHVFAYLDRYYLPSRQNGNLIDIAANIFDKHLFGSEIKKKIYLENFAKHIAIYRKNMIITNSHLYEFIRQLYAINTELYFEFKKVYLDETKLFYNTKFNEIKHEEPIHFYNRIINFIYFEDTLSSFCLYWTEEELAKQRALIPILFTKEIIEPYTDIFISHQRGLIWALKQLKIPLLNIITDIYSKFEGFEKIKKVYYQYVEEESKSLLRALQPIKDQSVIIHSISQFFNKHLTILSLGLKKHNQMQVTLSNALEFCIGKWQKISDTLFKYCTKKIAQGSFALHSEKIKMVFEKISSKDQFIHKCQTWVQSMILSDKTELNEQHKFVNFIHELCGSQNTLKLNKLLTDYIEQNKGNAKGPYFACKIISHHLWQRRFKEQIAVCLNLPSSLQQTWKEQLDKYSLANGKKKLRILPLTSRLILSVTFNQNNKLILKCNLLQASIILSLEEQPKTQQQLVTHINAEKHLINSFISSAKFITSIGQKLGIDWDSQEEGSRDYTEQFEEKSQYIKAIEQDRNILLQAGIVRMIKRRKEATFEELYNYLNENIKLFRPQPHMVKASIQKLIKRDFIESNQQGLLLYKQ